METWIAILISQVPFAIGIFVIGIIGIIELRKFRKTLEKILEKLE